MKHFLPILALCSIVSIYSQAHAQTGAGQSGPGRSVYEAPKDRHAVVSAERFNSSFPTNSRQSISSAVRRIVEGIADVAPQVSIGETRKVSHKLLIADSSSSGLVVFVRAVYDARPVGGILHLSIELSTNFSGIGLQSLPACRRSYAQTVYELSPEEVEQILAQVDTDLCSSATTVAIR